MLLSVWNGSHRYIANGLLDGDRIDDNDVVGYGDVNDLVGCRFGTDVCLFRDHDIE